MSKNGIIYIIVHVGDPSIRRLQGGIKMQQSPILVMDISEGSSSLKIEYISEDSIDRELNGEAATHIYRVRMITEHILRYLCENGSKLGAALTEEDISAISIASSLHDIGKQQIPKSILDSTEVLRPLEYDIIKRHAVLGEQIISKARLNDVSPKIVEYAKQIARCHHERIDGLGYPDGLRGDEIPLCAQVVAIADSYDALTSVRSYKQALPPDVALQMISSENCGAFDEELVKCLSRVIKYQSLVSLSESLEKKRSIVRADQLTLNRVLILGNTDYVDKRFAESTFPQSKVTILGSNRERASGKTKFFSTRSASIESILDTYEFDLIVFLAEGLSFRSSAKSDAEELRNLLKCASKMQRDAKILYLSPLDAAFEGNIDRAIMASANEKMCEFYAEKHALDTKVIRIPYLYSGTCKKDFLHNIFEQLYADKTVTIPESALSKMHFLSISDLSELISCVVDDWRGGGILSVGDEFGLTFADLAKKLTELDEHAKIDFTDSDCSGELKFNNNNLRNNHGWFAKISLIGELSEQYARFLETKGKTTFLSKVKGWLSRHSTFIKIVELLLLFAVTEVLVRLTGSSLIFSIVDFRTIFIVIMATMYGTSFGIASALLASVSYFVSRLESGTNALTIFYEPTNWIAFAIFFAVGGLCGYIQLKNKDYIKTVEEQSELLKDKLGFTMELYEETLQDKKALKKQIVSSKDSFGKILNISKSLNSVVPQQIYLKIVETFEEALENKSVAIYLVNPDSIFGRLQAASRNTLGTISGSIKLDDYAPVIEALKNGGVWKNTDLNLDYPAYAAGVYRDDKLILLIFLWHANTDQRSLYYVNLFKILRDLAQMSLLRAYDYSLALYEKQYIPGTRIMNAQYFNECVDHCRMLEAKKVSSFTMLEVDADGRTFEEIDRMISNKVRTADIVGVTSEGRIRIILPQASHDDLKYVLPRFEGIDVQIKILR